MMQGVSVLDVLVSATVRCGRAMAGNASRHQQKCQLAAPSGTSIPSTILWRSCGVWSLKAIPRGGKAFRRRALRQARRRTAHWSADPSQAQSAGGTAQ